MFKLYKRKITGLKVESAFKADEIITILAAPGKIRYVLSKIRKAYRHYVFMVPHNRRV